MGLKSTFVSGGRMTASAQVRRKADGLLTASSCPSAFGQFTTSSVRRCPAHDILSLNENRKLLLKIA